MNEKIHELLTRGVSEIMVKEDLEKKLLSGKKLRIYLGIDPTGSLLHLGHAVVLHKLRLFQELGHEVILLIGDFTAKIGDPTGKDATRVPLTDAQIRENFKNYKKQASKILNFSKVKIKYNSTWLSKLRYEDVLKLSSHVTVQQMLHREMFDKRIKEDNPISITEFQYPLMQGYDSVAMNVDVEVGGSDQLFNMLTGRDLQKAYNNKDKDVLTVRLLIGTDGRKMSKSYGNFIALDEKPNDMFGKVMSIKDELIVEYLELATQLSSGAIDEIKKLENPRDQKVVLAKEIVTMYHGEDLAKKAHEAFDNTFRNKELPENIDIFETDKKIYPIVDLLCDAKLAESRNDAKRVIEGGGVHVTVRSVKVKIESWSEELAVEDNMVVQFGKRKFIRIKAK